VIEAELAAGREWAPDPALRVPGLVARIRRPALQNGTSPIITAGGEFFIEHSTTKKETKL
jgi:hypothetical protein